MKTHEKLLIATLVLASAALGGCSDDNSPTGPAAPGNSVSIQDGSLEMTIGTNKASYAFGEKITVSASLRNTGSTPVALDFARGNPARYSNIGLNIKDDGDVSHFVEGDGTDDQTTLGAGKAITYSWEWDQVSRLSRNPVDRGVYEVVGFSGFDDRKTVRADGLFIELK